MEEHNVYCQSCEQDLGPCTELDCCMRWNHAVEVCAACREEEQKREWEKP